MRQKARTRDCSHFLSRDFSSQDFQISLPSAWCNIQTNLHTKPDLRPLQLPQVNSASIIQILKKSASASLLQFPILPITPPHFDANAPQLIASRVELFILVSDEHYYEERRPQNSCWYKAVPGWEWVQWLWISDPRRKVYLYMEYTAT